MDTIPTLLTTGKLQNNQPHDCHAVALIMLDTQEEANEAIDAMERGERVVIMVGDLPVIFNPTSEDIQAARHDADEAANNFANDL